MADLKFWVWFSRAVGNHRAGGNMLLDEVLDVSEIYKMTGSEIKRLGITEEELLSSLGNKDLSAAEREIKIAEKYNIKILTPEDENYPENLHNITDSPYILYRRGTCDTFSGNQLRIAIVGSRRASEYGKNVAYELAYNLAKRGVIIISGMATGIDARAHQGAIDAGGKTIAVLGCGVNIVYPKDNSNLMVDIMKNGEVISEYPFDTPPHKWNFPHRNRIISGLCDGLIVVEAEEVSGTSITANLALEQGKELFAVPGNITSPTSVGTNRLIKSGAVPVTCSEDVLEQFDGYDIAEYNPLPETPDIHETGEETEEDAPEKLILQAVRTDALTPDEISLKTGLSLSQITGVLTIMEIAGLVEMTPGHKYIKTSKLK